jgi:CheY-like chemotaxis protein
LKLDVRQANPRAVVEEALDLFGVVAADKDIELLHWVDDDVPAVVKLDDARLRQVLVNLISNAVKFTEKGSVAVDLRVEPAGAAASNVCRLKFSVRDTGIGIAPEDQVRLFKPFTQVDDSNARRFGGTGLGLSISRNLVQLMGGEISIESVPGQGSVFSFTVPIEAGPPFSRSVADLSALCAVLCAGPGPFRDEFARCAKRWRLPLTVIGQAAGRNASPSEIAFVELSFERARRLAAEPAGALPWASERAYALVPMSLENSVRSALRAHFVRLINKPLHHDAMLGLLAGIKPFATAEKAGPREFGLNVLIVEDNPVNQRLVQKLLLNLGCKTTVADNGRIGVEALAGATTPFDLVLMDLHMPELDGPGAIVKIRRGEAGPAAASVWITVLTADGRPEQRQHMMAAGANDYLLKPVSVAELAASLKRFIDLRQSLPTISI